MKQHYKHKIGLLLLGVMLLVGLTMPLAAQPAEPIINEFSFNTVGSPDVEYIEIFGTPNTDYSNYRVIQVEGDAATGFAAVQPGLVDTIGVLGTTNAQGYFTVSYTNGELENGTTTLLLVKNATPNLVPVLDLDTNNDGTLDATPWDAIVDSVAVNDNGTGDVIYSSVVLMPNFDGGVFTPGGASRIPNGVDTNAVSDWKRNDFDLAGIAGFTGTPVVGEALNTPNAINQAVGSIVPPPPTVTKIHTIQGSGLTVTSTGTFTVEAIVIGDYQRDNAPNPVAGGAQLQGFFIQEEDADVDANPLTSEGMFVFCQDCPKNVAVGDKVQVTGAASDFFGMSQLTATTADSITIVSSNNPLPTPTSLTLPAAIGAQATLNDAVLALTAYYEPWEGMLVKFTDTLTVAEHFQLARFGQIVLTQGARPRQFTDVSAPDANGYTQHQINVLSRSIILDDDDNVQNSALVDDVEIYHPRNGLSQDNYFRAGDTISNLTGVLHWSFAGQSGTEAWRIRPVPEKFQYQFTPANPRPNPYSVADVGGNFRVAAFNVLNYFTTIDTTASNNTGNCGPSGTLDCRGADSANEFAYQQDKIVTVLCVIDADILGVIEIENNATASMLALKNALNASQGCGPYEFIDTGIIGTDAIKVGLLYKSNVITPVGNFAILDNSFDADYADTSNRPALAQTFQLLPAGDKITVVVNHLKSKGSECGAGDDDLTTGQGNCAETRRRAAEVEVAWLATDPTGQGTDDILVIGDLNAYRKETAIQEFTDAGYVDLIDQFIGADAYSFLFGGQLGYLDHALASPSLAAKATGAAEFHINADEIPLFDYNDDIKDTGEASFEEEPDTLSLNGGIHRSSDHDPLIVGFTLSECPPFPLTVNNQLQLNGAIECYNSITTPGVYEIIFGADISLTHSTRTINNPTNGVQLLISGKNKILDGQDIISVRPIEIASKTIVTIDALILEDGNTQGNHGGAIYNLGNLKITKSILRSNITSSGGAIANYGTLTVVDTAITDNSALDFGGGIYNGATTVSIINSTFSDNDAPSNGGAIYTHRGSVFVANSTFSLNMVFENQYTRPESLKGGSIFNFEGKITIINSTFSDHSNPEGGVIHSNKGSVTLANTIIANTKSGNDCATTGTVTFTFVGKNLIEDGSCNAVANGQLTGDPNLAPLANNGGLTQTHALLPGSIAINAGVNAEADDAAGNPLTTDQRGAGFSRILGGIVDLGAFEAHVATITILKDTQPNDATDFEFVVYKIANNQSSIVSEFVLDDDGNNGNVLSNEKELSVSAGRYAIAEKPNTGWDVTIECRSDNTGRTFNLTQDINTQGAAVAFDLNDNEDVTCRFINEKTSGITIKKEVVYVADLDTDSGTNFIFGGDFPQFQLDDPLVEDNDGITDTKVFNNLAAGTYEVVESANGSWIQTVTCTGDTDNGSVYDNVGAGVDIDLDAGENIVCTFKNVRVTYELTYKKVLENAAALGSDWIFTLQPQGEALINPFATIPGAGGTGISFTLPVDAYTVGEIVPPGYDLKKINCGDGGVSVDFPANDNFFIILQQDTTCTFTNVAARTTTITIKKEVEYVADLDTDSERNFIFGGDFPQFELDDPQNGDDADGVTDTKLFSDLAAGTYEVVESANGSWIQTVSCTGDTDNGSVYDNVGAGVDIDLDAGENIVCTFKNERVTYELTYNKVLENAPVPGSDWQFTLQPQGEALISPFTTAPAAGGNSTTYTLPVDAYTVGEIVPPGYDLKKINCGDGGVSVDFPASDSFFIILQQDLTCTFTNISVAPTTGSIRVTKDIIGNGTGQFTICVNNDCRNFNGDGAQDTWDNLTPGQYVVSEQDAGADWSEPAPQQVEVAAGQQVEITVTNTYTPSNVCNGLDPLNHLTAVIEPTGNPNEWQAKITNSSVCLYDVGFAAYEKPDNNNANQILFSSDTRLQIPQGVTTIVIPVPTCAAQLDVFFDASHLGVYNTYAGQQANLDLVPLVLPSFASNLYGPFGNWYGPRLLAFKHVGVNFCAPPPVLREITIQKSSGDPGYDAQVFFDGDLPDVNDAAQGDFSTNGNGGLYTFQNLAAGVYNVTEIVPDGWTLTSVTCNGNPMTINNNTVAIDVTNGDATCTFNNTYTPPIVRTITIQKSSGTPGFDAQVFFDGDLPDMNGDALGDFSTNGNGGLYTFQNLAAGVYNVSEFVPAGWVLSSVTCNGNPMNINNNSVAIDVTNGDATCTFNNTFPDGDNDGVGDAFDQCPDTLAGIPVDGVGCPIIVNVSFFNQIQCIVNFSFAGNNVMLNFGQTSQIFSVPAGKYTIPVTSGCTLPTTHTVTIIQSVDFTLVAIPTNGAAAAASLE
jgi:predicted extracellular nuclease